MARNVRRMQCDPEAVFDVIAEGWLYPAWVVGASRMREVDSSWPQPGSRLHHSVGVWPLLINDSTSCIEWDPPRRAALTARGWPLGEARVTIDVKPQGDGCLVKIQEEAVSGPAVLVSPLIDLLLLWRNAETLHRLAYLAEGIGPRRHSTAQQEDPETAR